MILIATKVHARKLIGGFGGLIASRTGPNKLFAAITKRGTNNGEILGKYPTAKLLVTQALARTDDNLEF
jgi:hypothetical protein